MQTGYQAVIDKYYPHNNELRHILLTHSRSVADLALTLAKRLPELNLDLQFVEEAAMLHDIGIVRCDAPSIHCHGTEPYIAHDASGRRNATPCPRLRTTYGRRHHSPIHRSTAIAPTLARFLTRNARRTADLLCRQVFQQNQTRPPKDGGAGREEPRQVWRRWSSTLPRMGGKVWRTANCGPCDIDFESSAYRYLHCFNACIGTSTRKETP